MNILHQIKSLKFKHIILSFNRILISIFTNDISKHSPTEFSFTNTQNFNHF